MDIEEIVKFLNENPDKTKELSGKVNGYVIRSNDDDGNHVNSVISGLSSTDPRVKHITSSVTRADRERLESLTKKFTGIDKKPLEGGGFETAFDHMESAFTEFLESQKTTGKKDGDSYEEKIRLLQDERNQDKLTHEQSIKELQQDHLNELMKMEYIIKAGKQSFPSSLDETDKELIINGRLEEFRKMNPIQKDIDGKKVFVATDESGSIKYKDSKVVDMDSFIQNAFSKYSGERNINPSNEDVTNIRQGSTGFVFDNAITTKVALTEAIQKQLGTTESDEAVQVFAKHSENLA